MLITLLPSQFDSNRPFNFLRNEYSIRIKNLSRSLFTGKCQLKKMARKIAVIIIQESYVSTSSQFQCSVTSCGRPRIIPLPNIQNWKLKAL